ncbi:MAG: hypothetical protein MK101_12490 [Phycisphaerales bacterium]|nr:hypothetical protein [Phycisphaerales bacterium]
MFRRLHVFVTGLLGLALVALRARGRLRGAYWDWRQSTAFGADPARWPSASRRRRSMLEFGAWVWAMRRV